MLQIFLSLEEKKHFPYVCWTFSEHSFIGKMFWKKVLKYFFCLEEFMTRNTTAGDGPTHTLYLHSLGRSFKARFKSMSHMIWKTGFSSSICSSVLYHKPILSLLPECSVLLFLIYTAFSSKCLKLQTLARTNYPSWKRNPMEDPRTWLQLY